MAKRLTLSAEMLKEILSPPHTWGQLFMQVTLLEQPRNYHRYRGHIVNLANMMVEQGQIQATELVRYSTTAAAQQHLELLRCYGEESTVDDLRRDRLGRYSAVSFGHCRTLAHRVLWLYGCDICRSEHGQEAPGTCYRRHRRGIGLNYKVTYNDDPDPEMVVDRQFGENTGRSVDPADEAATIYGRWQMAKAKDPTLTVDRFRRRIGRAEVVVERAIGLAQAPQEVKDAVDNDDITFTVGSELGRYHYLLAKQAEELSGKAAEACLERAQYLVVEYWLKRAQVRRPGYALDSQMARVRGQRLPQDVFLRSMRNEIEEARKHQGSLLAELTPEEAQRLTAQRQTEANYTLAGALKAAREVLVALKGASASEQLDLIGERLDPEVANEFRRFIEELGGFTDHILGAGDLIASVEDVTAEEQPTLSLELAA